jgi:nicotinate-nucleotide pyrophosphorylase (carboxylating)
MMTPEQVSQVPEVCPEFRQSAWNPWLAGHVEGLARQWLAEDLGHECDWTSLCVIEPGAVAELDVVARRSGVVAGLDAAAVVARVVDEDLRWHGLVADGGIVEAGTVVARIAGSSRSLLAAERTILNLIGRMSGVATSTRRLVDAVSGTRCRVYDTRKTVPGWRLLDKLATRLGGGWNHRTGLYDAILIKDNHLAALAATGVGPAVAVEMARRFLAETFPPERAGAMVVEVEVDSLGQLGQVLAARPDIVLLDNMPPHLLREAVAERNRSAPGVILEASGGIRLETVRSVAETGVERVSTGWPTHDSAWLDVALDWPNAGPKNFSAQNLTIQDSPG